MKSHLSRQHEMPAALDALGKNYEAKYKSMLEENAVLKKQLEQIKGELVKTRTDLVQALDEGLKKYAEINRLNGEMQKMGLIIAFRDSFIKEKLGITMPLPS